MAPRNLVKAAHGSRALRSQARTALKEKENINIPSPVERDSQKLAKVARKTKQAVREPSRGEEQPKLEEENAHLEVNEQLILGANVDKESGVDLNNLNGPEFEHADDSRMNEQHLPLPSRESNSYSLSRRRQIDTEYSQEQRRPRIFWTRRTHVMAPFRPVLKTKRKWTTYRLE